MFLIIYFCELILGIAGIVLSINENNLFTRGFVYGAIAGLGFGGLLFHFIARCAVKGKEKEQKIQKLNQLSVTLHNAALGLPIGVLNPPEALEQLTIIRKSITHTANAYLSWWNAKRLIDAFKKAEALIAESYSFKGEKAPFFEHAIDTLEKAERFIR